MINQDTEFKDGLKVEEDSKDEKQAGGNGELEQRLKNWVNERSGKGERQARDAIARAMIVDLRPPTKPKQEHRVAKYRGWVEGSSHQTIRKLTQLYEKLKNEQKGAMASGLQKRGNLVIGLQEIPGRGEQVLGTDPERPNIDSETKEPFLTRIVREPNAWVAEEIRPVDGSFISQVRIYDDDNRTPEMSMFFTGPRYEERGAQLSVSPVDPQRFPTGARVAFNYLAGSVGQIDWYKPSHMARLIPRSIH